MNNPDAVAEKVLAVLEASLASTLAEYESTYSDDVELGTPTFWRAPQRHYPGDLNVVVVIDTPIWVNSSDEDYHRFTGRVDIIAAGQQDHATYTPAATVNKRVWRVARAVQSLVHTSTLLDTVEMAYVQDMEFASPLDGHDSQEQHVTAALDIVAAAA